MKRNTLSGRIFLRVSMPLFLWVALMIFGSSVPGNDIPEIPLWNWDKLAHAFEYAVMAALLYRYLALRWRLVWQKRWKLTVAIGLVYGVLDELHQMFIPMRSCTWQDFVSDMVGVTTGMLIMIAVFRRRSVS